MIRPRIKPDIKKLKRIRQDIKKPVLPTSAAKKLINPRLSKKHKLPDDPKDIAQSVPRITNETVEKHRKEVIKGGRKYAYPIINTPKRIVSLSLLVGFVSLMLFTGYTMLRLYRFNDYSDFVYNVTKVVPVPVARVGGRFVEYEDYLFELRRSINFFESQQQVDFGSKEEQGRLTERRQVSMQRTLDNAYIQKLARQHNLTVTSEELDSELDLLRSQNKLGDVDKAFEEVLKDFWKWTIKDYRKYLSGELLRQKVAASLDPDTQALAEEVLAKIAAGEDFAVLAAQYSADLLTAETGGEYAALLSADNNSFDPKLVEAAFSANVGTTTGIVNTGYELEILRISEEIDGKRRVSHISFIFADITPAINDLKEAQPASVYIKTD